MAKKEKKANDNSSGDKKGKAAKHDDAKEKVHSGILLMYHHPSSNVIQARKEF
jgi:hypothetical protein